MSDHRLSRRDFLTQTAIGASAATLVPREVVGGPAHTPPSDKVRVGCIGIGGMGGNDVRAVAALEETEIVALCDVDRKRGKEVFTAFPDAAQYEDYREMLSKESASLDAVTVSTPDHNHAPATVRALKDGKHVFCQKPLTHTVAEARRVGQVAERASVATRMGIQHHTDDGLRRLRELLEAGTIGTVQKILVWTNRPIWPQAMERPLEMYHEPDHLNWNLWLGPAPERPYHPDYAPFNWRGWYAFGTGALGDIGCHALDGAFWSLQLDPPTRVRAETTPTYDETYPEASRITYEFPGQGSSSGLELIWMDGNLRPPKPASWNGDEAWPPSGYNQLFVGDDGALLFGTGKTPRLLPKERHKQVMANPPERKYSRSDGHYKAWIDACKAGTSPEANFADYSAPLTELVLLGNLAVRAQRPIERDASTGQITNGAGLNELLTKEHRKGWKL